MFHQKAIQNSWRQSVHRHANVVYLGASVGMQKIAGTISSKLNVTSSPELLSALAEYKLGFSLEVLTATHAVHAVDEPMDPGMNLRNEPESGPHAYEITDSLFVSLDNEAPPAGSNPELSYKALQSSVCKRPTVSLEGPRDEAGSLNVPIGKPGKHGAGHGVNIVKSTKAAVRQVMFHTTDDVIFCPLEGTAMGLLSDMMKLGLDPEMITKVLDDALRQHNKTGAYKFKIEHVPCTRAGFCIDFQVGNTIMSTMAFATDHNGVLQVAFVARAPGTKNFGPIKDNIRAEVRNIEPTYPLGDYDVSHMNIFGMVQEAEGYKWGLTAHARKVITSRYRHPRGNTFVFTRARRSASSSRAKPKEQVPGYVALQQYPGDEAAMPSSPGPVVHVVQPSNGQVNVPSRLTETSGFDSIATDESDATGGLVIKEIGVVRHERNKAIWAKKSVSNSNNSLARSATRFKELKVDKALSKKAASGEAASSRTEVPTTTDPSTLKIAASSGSSSDDLGPLFSDTLAASLMGRALQSLLDQIFQGQEYDADDSKNLFSDAQIKERADLLRQRDVRRAKGRKEKEAKVRQQARKAAKEVEAQDGVPPKYIPLRATGAHRDQIKAREAAAAPAKTQVSSALPSASRSSTISSPTVNVKPASSRPAQPLDDVKNCGTGPVNTASAERRSPDSIDRSATASPVLFTANGRNVIIPGASNEPPAPPAGPSPAEASMEEVLSDLEEAGWPNVTRSEVIGLKHKGQSDIGSPGAFVKRSKNKGKGKVVSTSDGTTPSPAPLRTTATAAISPTPGSTSGVPSTAAAPKAHDKGKGKAGATIPASSVPVPAPDRATAPARAPTPGPSSPRKPARQSSPSWTTTNRRGYSTNANTAFRIGHPGLGTVARTMTTGTLDPITSHMPTEWLDEHVLAEALLNDTQQEALNLASEGLDSVTDARHPDELYPGASDYNLDIDDYCISRGGMEESEAERMELERYHLERTEEDRIMLENRGRARFELQLMMDRAIEERHRLDSIAAEEQARARVNPFDNVLNEWANGEWPDELARDY